MTERKSVSALIVVVALAVLGLAGLWWWSLGGDDTTRSKAEYDQAQTQGQDAEAHSEPPSRVSWNPRALLDADRASVSGTVRDPGGQAIAGASVCAGPSETELRGAGVARPRCATSEADGHYQIDELWPVPTRIAASAAGFVPATYSRRVGERVLEQLRLHADQDTSGIDLVLEPGGVAVRGVVADISGGAVESALVTGVGAGSWSRKTEARAVALSDAEGRFELWLGRGRATLRAEAEGYAITSTTVRAPAEHAELFLTPESVIAGRVVRAGTDEGVADVTVQAMDGDAAHGTALSDASGRFRVSGLHPGSYALVAVSDSLYGEAREQLHVGLMEAVEDVVVELHTAHMVTGVVMIAGREQPCPEGRVELRDGETGHRASAAIGDEGQATLRGLLAGNYRVSVSCPDFVPEPSYPPVELAEADVEGLVWEVRAGLTIRGEVVAASGQPLAGYSVFADPERGPDDDPRAQSTVGESEPSDADGRFEIHGLLPGRYSLGAFGPESRRLEQPVIVELGPSADAEHVQLVMPGSGALVGHVRDDVGEGLASVWIHADRRDGVGHGRVVSGDDGRFEFAAINAGEYRVTARASSWGRLRRPGSTDDDVQGERVEVIADQQTEIELVVERRTHGISGRVVDTTGAELGDAFVSATRVLDSAASAASRSRAAARWGGGHKPVLTEPDGGFMIEGLPAGTYTVFANRKGGGEGLVEGVEAGSTGVEVRILDTASIAGKVTTASGETPARFRMILADRTQGFSRSEEFFRTEGEFAIRELPPGNYKLTVGAPEGTASTELTLAAAEHLSDLRLELEGLVNVRGRLVDIVSGEPIPGMHVTIAQRGGNLDFGGDESEPGSEISDSDGRFEVSSAPVGKVRVTIVPRDPKLDSPYGWTTRMLSIAPEPEVQDVGEIGLIAQRMRADEPPGDPGFSPLHLGSEVEWEDWRIEVAVVRPGGPAAAAGLKVKDVIASIDGVGILGLDSYRYRELILAPAGTALKLELSDGRSVVLVLGPPL